MVLFLRKYVSAPNKYNCPGRGMGEQAKQHKQQCQPLCDPPVDQRHPDPVHQLELRLCSCCFPPLHCGGRL